MKNIKYNVWFALAILFTLASCDHEDPMADEQYYKQIYMVGAYEGVYAFDVKFSDTSQEAYVSVAMSGTHTANHDVTVTLGYSDEAIATYNRKYMGDKEPVKYQRLPDAYYDMPTMTGTIPANQVYGRIPLSVKSTGLHCDSLYALAFKIESVSHYSQNELTPTLIMNIKLTNDYSGLSQYEARKSNVKMIDENPQNAELTGTSAINGTRTLTAVNQNAIRLFHEQQAEKRSGYSNNAAYWKGLENYGVVFARVGETDAFEIKNWKTYSTNGDETAGLNILDGKATYANGTFTFWYDYMEGSERKRIEGTLKK